MTDPLELLTTEQAATRTGLSAFTLAKHRKQRKGIPYVVVAGRTVRYRTADVLAYLAAHTVRPGEPKADGGGLPRTDTLQWAPPHLRGRRM